MLERRPVQASSVKKEVRASDPANGADPDDDDSENCTAAGCNFANFELFATADGIDALTSSTPLHQTRCLDIRSPDALFAVRSKSAKVRGKHDPAVS